ncbi:MAG: hypothetical protein U0736_17575 [Gemmataceae bacterium]
MILYEMLAGRLPFQGRPRPFWCRTVADEPPPVEQLRPEAGPVLAGIVAKMMAKAPAARYAGMADVAAVLADYLREGCPQGNPPPLHRLYRRRVVTCCCCRQVSARR